MSAALENARSMKSERCRLPRQQTRSHAVHGDAVIGRVDRGKDPYDLCYALAPRFKKRVRAILPGAPRYEDFG